jgi:hypothetical protein
MAVLKAFLVNNKFEEDEIHALIESLDVYADNFMKEIDEINSVKGRHRYSGKTVRGGMFSCAGLSDIGPIPKFNVMKFMR